MTGNAHRKEFHTALHQLKEPLDAFGQEVEMMVAGSHPYRPFSKAGGRNPPPHPAVDGLENLLFYSSPSAFERGWSLLQRLSVRGDGRLYRDRRVLPFSSSGRQLP